MQYWLYCSTCGVVRFATFIRTCLHNLPDSMPFQILFHKCMRWSPVMAIMEETCDSEGKHLRMLTRRFSSGSLSTCSRETCPSGPSSSSWLLRFWRKWYQCHFLMLWYQTQNIVFICIVFACVDQQCRRAGVLWHCGLVIQFLCHPLAVWHQKQVHGFYQIDETLSRKLYGAESENTEPATTWSTVFNVANAKKEYFRN